MAPDLGEYEGMLPLRFLGAGQTIGVQAQVGLPDG